MFMMNEKIGNLSQEREMIKKKTLNVNCRTEKYNSK